MNNQVQKNRFLKDFLVVSSKDGWNLNVFNKVKKKLKYSSTLINKLFPKKLEDLILFYNVAINQELSKIYKKRKFDKKKGIRISILNAVKTRFELIITVLTNKCKLGIHINTTPCGTKLNTFLQRKLKF